MGFASVKEVIRRFSGLEDRLRFQAIFVLFRAFYWTFRLELCSSAKGQRLGSTNGVQGRLNVGRMLLLIALLDVASIGGTVMDSPYTQPLVLISLYLPCRPPIQGLAPRASRPSRLSFNVQSALCRQHSHRHTCRPPIQGLAPRASRPSRLSTVPSVHQHNVHSHGATISVPRG